MFNAQGIVDDLRDRRIQRALLRRLRQVHPEEMDLRSLQFSMDHIGYPMSAEMLKAHLRDLEEKGYVYLQARKGFGFSIALAEITAKGMEFAEQENI